MLNFNAICRQNDCTAGSISRQRTMGSYVWTHQALNISEILHRICEHLPYDRATLAVLARTAKIFYEPAIASLWYNIPNLVPLVRFFPPDSWELRDNVIVCLLCAR